MRDHQSVYQDPDERVTPLEARIESATEPFLEFVKNQKSSSFLLLICTASALLLANLLPESYFHAIDIPMGFMLADQVYGMSAKHWVNDGLMALFFFLLGLEIKREFMAGHLKEAGARNLIIFASMGGMVFPALIYLIVNAGDDGILLGWGVPMATDTAFAIGVLALLGSGAPRALFSFLVAYAIIDDLGAILVIALFYSEALAWSWLGGVAVLFAALAMLNVAGFRHPLPYTFVGVALWLCMLNSGVHATLAGILVALTVPARPRHGSSWLVKKFSRSAHDMDVPQVHERPILESEQHHQLLRELEESTRLSMTPLQRWEGKLDMPVSLLIMPIFALFNAGVVLSGDTVFESLSHPIGLGILLGLLVGKPLGIFAMSWLALKIGWGQLPKGLTMQQVLGLGLLGGIGFTMSIFISNLAFGSDPVLINAAKIAILCSSAMAALFAFALLSHSLRTKESQHENAH